MPRGVLDTAEEEAMNEQARCGKRQSATRRAAQLVLAVALWLVAPAFAYAQGGGCILVPEGVTPAENILRCGPGLTIRVAPGTVYRLTAPRGSQQPTRAQLDSGALLIEFDRGTVRRNFQIQTPHAIAAVRGTTWAVDVTPAQTSTFVVTGAVSVTRVTRSNTVVLADGEGVDVAPGTGPLKVTRWGEPRVRALLSRFGQ
jgi:FecR protein